MPIFITSTLKPSPLWKFSKHLTILLLFTSISILPSHADGSKTPNPPIDFGEDLLYTLDSIDEKAIQELKAFDIGLWQFGYVDKNYKYTDVQEATGFFESYQKQKNKHLRSYNQNENNTTKITIIDSSPYRIVTNYRLPDVMNDNDRMVMGAMLNSPALLKGMCERLYVTKSFRANNVQLIYRYTDKNNEVFATQTLDMDTCKGTTPIENYQPIKQQEDEAPSELVKQFDERFTSRIANATQAEKDSFYYLMAIGYELPANKDDEQSLIQAGKTVVKKVLLAQNNKKLKQKHRDDLISNAYKDYHTIRFIDTDDYKTIFCMPLHPNENGKVCIENILTHKDQWQQAIDDHQLAYQRYQTYLNRTPAVNLLAENVYNPTPLYQLLTIGRKISRLYSLQMAENGQTQLALDKLVTEFNRARKHFANANNALEKAIWQTILSDQLQTMILLKTRYDDSLSAKPIQPLIQGEHSMDTLLYREYQMTAGLLKDMNPHNDASVNQFFKLNNSLNALATLHQQFLENNQTTASDLARHVMEDTYQQNEFDDLFLASNTMGKQMVMMAIVDYDGYHVRNYNLDNQINAVNYLLTNGKVKLNNIFATHLTGVSKSDSAICYDTPTHKPNEYYRGEDKADKMDGVIEACVWL